MFTNFFRIALRYLWRNKTYSTLNFLCLTFGLTCAIIAVLFIMNVFSWDKFHKNYERLYSTEAYVTFFNGDRFPKGYLSASLNDVLSEQVPEIEEMTRTVNKRFNFEYNDKTFSENGIYADSNFFNLFTFSVIQGNTQNMRDLNTIMISERMAKKFFENTDCIGKTLAINDDGKKESYKITAVLNNVPAQSWLQFDYVIPFSKFIADNRWANETGASANQLWVLLKNGVDKNYVDTKIKDLIKNQETTLNQELFLFPLSEKLLYKYAGGKRIWDEMQNVVIVGSIGFAILLIACFNFINMAIALNIRRYREAGIKKVVGSSKAAIVRQFLGETFFITLISLFIAIIVTKLLVTGFNTIFHQDIHFYLSNISIILIFTTIALFTGLLSGLFPALYLASSNPLNVLKGRIITSHSYSAFRQGLIVFQFTVPIILIICMMVIKTQDSYLRSYDIGVDKDNLIVLDNSENIQKHAESVKAELLSIPGIDAVSYTNCIPARGFAPTNDVSWEGKDGSEKLHFWCINTDFDYAKTVKVNITDGRFFDKSFSSDSACFVINDVAANVIKNKNPVGSIITVDGKKGTVVGVFNNFHVVDLAGPYTPTIIHIKPEDRPTILIKFSTESYSSMKEKIRKVYTHYEPELTFQPTLYRDLPDYAGLTTPSKLIGVAFIIALSLACLGLLGLAAFTSESRTKEIGIRKINGATTKSVMHLLLSNYTKWLTIAFFIALPIAYVVVNMFLGRFHFHTSMPYWAFIVGPVIAYVIALSTVSWQSWRAATRNPVEALRYE